MSDSTESKTESKTPGGKKTYGTPRLMTPAERMARDKACRKEYYQKRAGDMIKRSVTHYAEHRDEILATLKVERDAKKLAKLQAITDSNIEILAWYAENQEKILAGEKAMENKLKLAQFIKKCSISPEPEPIAGSASQTAEERARTLSNENPENIQFVSMVNGEAQVTSYSAPEVA